MTALWDGSAQEAGEGMTTSDCNDSCMQKNIHLYILKLYSAPVVRQLRNTAPLHDDQSSGMPAQLFLHPYSPECSRSPGIQLCTRPNR